MKLRRLRVQRMPGIDQPFEVKLREDLTLIVGPNGSGKTTLCRAASALLWREDPPITDLSLTSSWEKDDGSELRAERQGSQPVQWMDGGRRVAAPAAPPPQIAGSYRLGLLELLGTEQNTTDRSLADEIRRQVAGGFSLHEVRQTLFVTRAQAGRSESRALLAAESRCVRLSEEHRKISASEERLEQLREQLGAARRAREEVGVLGTVRDLATERERAVATRQLLEEFPEGMDRLDGDELERLAEEQEQCEQQQAHLTEAAESIGALRQELAGLAFPGAPLAPEVLDGWGEKARHAEELGRLIEQRQSAAEAAAARERAAAEGLDPDTGAGAAPISASLVEELTSGLAEIDNLRASHQVVLTEIEIQQQERRSERKPLSSSSRWLPVVMGAALAGAGFYLGATAHPAWYLLAAFGGSGLVAAVWMASRAAGPGEGAGEEKGGRLAAKERALAGKISERREAFLRRAAEAGLEIQKADASAVWLADRLSRWQHAREESVEAAEHSRSCENQLNQHLSELGSLLSQHGGSAEVDAASARAAVAALDRRSREIITRSQQLAELERTLARHHAALKKARQRIERLYHDAGVDPDDQASLRSRLERRDKYLEVAERLRSAMTLVAASEKKLAGRADVLAWSAAEIDRELQEAQALAQGLDRLLSEIAGIEQAVRHAREGNALEGAMEEVDRCRQKLVERQQEGLLEEAGRFLLDRVHRQYQQESQPEVLGKARQLLKRFTDHRYDLRLNDEQTTAGFYAYDHVADRRVELSQLSDGTRTQLLLAVRLAFITLAEEGARWPLFLDDALSATDPERFEAVARSLLRLVEQGRQVIYLTCDPGEIHRWNQVVEGWRGRRQIELIHLAPDPPPPPPPPPDSSPVPKPDGFSPEEYAVLIQVPEWNPLQPLGQIHLYTLLHRDLDCLYKLLQCRIKTVGQLLSMLDDAPLAEAVLSAPQIQALEKGSQILSSFLRAYQQGRGRPVDRLLLEQSQAVSETFIEEVSALAATLGSDARRLITALEERQVKKFRDHKIDALEVYLIEQGALDPRQVLDWEELKRQVLLETSALWPERISVPEVVQAALGLWEMSTRLAD